MTEKIIQLLRINTLAFIINQLNMPQLQSKEHELKSYKTARVMLGLFLNFTFVTMRGPNKTIETEKKIWDSNPTQLSGQDGKQEYMRPSVPVWGQSVAYPNAK